MAGQALGFGELLAGGVLLTMGISGQSIRDVLKGKGGTVKPIAVAAGGPAGSATASPGEGAGGEAAPSAASRAGHSNPLPGWSRSRIDQGVDFYGGRKIVAPEAGTVVKTGAPGWPGEGGVLLKLAKGGYLFFYEQLTAVVHVGQQVTAGQQIASGTPGGSIEVGFADASGVPLAHSEYSEGVVTKFGKAAARWLTLIGAPR